MKVKELIEKLKEQPQELEVSYVWDGAPRTVVDFVWTARNKTDVILCGELENIYDDEMRPEWAEKSEYWTTPIRSQ